MTIKYENLTKKVNELDGYYQKSKSVFLKKLIEDCLEKTLLATQVKQQFSKDLAEIFKNHIEFEQKSFAKNLEFLENIKKNNDDLKNFGLVSRDYLEGMENFVVENKKMRGEMSFISAQIIRTLLTEAIQMKDEQLFNEVFEVDISRFEIISVDKRNNLINARIVKLIPFLGKIVSETKFVIEVYKTFDPQNVINDAIEKGDEILNQIENYNIDIVKWINHTIALGKALKDNQDNFLNGINTNSE